MLVSLKPPSLHHSNGMVIARTMSSKGNERHSRVLGASGFNDVIEGEMMRNDFALNHKEKTAWTYRSELRDFIQQLLTA